jgi:hypothetical protein
MTLPCSVRRGRNAAESSVENTQMLQYSEIDDLQVVKFRAIRSVLDKKKTKKKSGHNLTEGLDETVAPLEAGPKKHCAV